MFFFPRAFTLWWDMLTLGKTQERGPRVSCSCFCFLPLSMASRRLTRSTTIHFAAHTTCLVDEDNKFHWDAPALSMRMFKSKNKVVWELEQDKLRYKMQMHNSSYYHNYLLNSLGFLGNNLQDLSMNLKQQFPVWNVFPCPFEVSGTSRFPTTLMHIQNINLR